MKEKTTKKKKKEKKKEGKSRKTSEFLCPFNDGGHANFMKKLKIGMSFHPQRDAVE